MGMYKMKTVKNAFAVGAALVANPQGLGLDGIGTFCGLSQKAARDVVKTLVAAGVVGSERIVVPVRGGGRKVVYFALFAQPGDAPQEDAREESELDEIDELDELDDVNEIDETDEIDDSFGIELDDERDDDSFGGGGSVVVCEDDCDFPPFSLKKRANNPAEIESPSYSININTNKNKNRINTRARKTSKKRLYETTVSECVAKVDLNAEPMRKLAAALESIMWEPSLKVDLIQRTCAGVALGLYSERDAIQWARDAVKASLKESCPIWYKFTLNVKGKFDRALKAFWDYTRDVFVSKPEKRVPFVSLELNDQRDREEDDDASVRIYKRNGRNFIAFA